MEKRGSRKPKRPDCSVDVVEATMIERSCAKEPPWPVKAKTVANAINRFFMSLILTSSQGGDARLSHAAFVIHLMTGVGPSLP